jgi:hypothetical protein
MSQARTFFRQALKTLLPRPLLQKMRLAIWSLGDLRHGFRTGQWDLPLAYLRAKVCGTGPDPAEIASAPDFGCSCGRVISVFQAPLPSAKFFGTDAVVLRKGEKVLERKPGD